MRSYDQYNAIYRKIHSAQSGNGHWIGSTQWAMCNAKWAMGNRHANRVLGKVGRYAMHLFTLGNAKYAMGAG